MEGASFRAVTLGRPDLRFPFPEGFAARLEGATLLKLERRGKYLIGALSSEESLIMHLGMSGRFTVQDERDEKERPGGFYYDVGGDAKHDHVIFRLAPLRSRTNAGVIVTYNDTRRFGFMDLVPSNQIDHCRHFKGMGPEPLSAAFNGEALSQALMGRMTPIKSALLDQRIVAGLGNIYVCEALFRAGVSPRRKSASVSGARAQRLAPIIKTVLEEAIAAGGSTLRDFAASDGALGYFQHAFQVYGREGEACVKCASPVRRIEQAGRSTFFCGACQR